MKRYFSRAIGLVLALVVLVACSTATIEESESISSLQIEDYAETNLPTTSGFEIVQKQYLSSQGLRTAANSEVDILGEVGTLSVRQASRDDWHRFYLYNNYSNPVVIMNPLSFRGAGPAHIRVRNVTSHSFEFKVEEWLYQNGQHKREFVSYIVAEEGSHLLGNLQLEVGSVSTDQNFEEAVFANRFSDTPVVLTQTQSFNGNQPVITRINDVTPERFGVRLQEEEALGKHKPEVVGYMAFSQGSGLLESEAPYGNGTIQTAYEVVLTEEVVNREWYDLEFEKEYYYPAFLASIQSYNGPNTANLRYKYLGYDGVSVKIQEERSKDDETYHRKESVGYIVLEAWTTLSSSCVATETRTGDILLSDQEQVDSLANVALIQGNLTIDPDSDLNLNALRQIKEITGSFTVYDGRVGEVTGPIISDDPDALRKLGGFDCLESIGEDFTISSGNLTSLEGFNALESIGGSMRIEGNGKLLSINGFESLKTIEDNLLVLYHPILNRFEGFSALETISGSLIFQYTFGVESLSNFPSLKTVVGGLVFNLSEITTIDGFNALTSVGGPFGVLQVVVEEIAGFNALEIANGGFVIAVATELTSISGFQSLENINGEFLVSINENLTSVSGFDKLEESGITEGSNVNTNPLFDCQNSPLSFATTTFGNLVNCDGVPDAIGPTGPSTPQ